MSADSLQFDCRNRNWNRLKEYPGICRCRERLQLRVRRKSQRTCGILASVSNHHLFSPGGGRVRAWQRADVIETARAETQRSMPKTRPVSRKFGHVREKQL